MPVKPGPANRASPSLTEEQDPAARRSHCDPKLFTIAGRCGRLGNRLIIFAQFIAFAEEHGHRLINFTFHSYAGFFESTRRDIYCQYPRASRTSWLDAIPGANALEVADAAGLAAVVRRLFADSAERQRVGASGRGVVDANRGSVARVLELVEPIL